MAGDKQAPDQQSASAVKQNKANTQRDPNSSAPVSNEHNAENQGPNISASNGRLEMSDEGIATGTEFNHDDQRYAIRITQKATQDASNTLMDLLAPLTSRMHRGAAQHSAAAGSRSSLLHRRSSSRGSGSRSRPSSPVHPTAPPPALNVVIQIVGSRGDVQPFVALGIELKKYGHRVRLATHLNFKSFVEDYGLEFFDIGGDPQALMAYSVKNPGLLPKFETVKEGEIARQKQGIYEIMVGCWRSCIESGDGIDRKDLNGTEKPRNSKPFIADAIIANPPSFAHVHCAESLGIPLHLMFTMPWSATTSFPHPLANVQESNTDAATSNLLSYTLVQILQWQGLGDITNHFRVNTLGLDPLSVIWAPGLIDRLHIPFTYCWSPSLIPKPKDWGPHINVAGFYTLNAPLNFKPDKELVDFLKGGEPPIYIGFGSIVVDDPDGMTKMIFDAVKQVGCRALVSKGWGGIGNDDLEIPENIFLLGNCPHDWLFPQVRAVVHHGGAGTTATGIFAGRPTVIVPFFGDQPFWGAMIARAGAGPSPIPFKSMTTEKFVNQLHAVLQDDVLEKAKILQTQMSKERGAEEGAKYFHEHLKVDDMRCQILPDHKAVFRVKSMRVRLSAAVTVLLAESGVLDLNLVRTYHSVEYDLSSDPWGPISGTVSAVLGTLTNVAVGVKDMNVIASRNLAKNANIQVDKHHRPSPPASPGASEAKSAKKEHNDSASPKKPGQDKAYANRKSWGQAASQTMIAVANGPTEFTLSLAKGFKNLSEPFAESTREERDLAEEGKHPKQYGTDKITGIKSGLRRAGTSFASELYHGFSGVVMEPIRGAQAGGTPGLFKGIMRGFSGLILKPEAALLSLPAYTMEGIRAQLHKRFHREALRANEHIIAAHLLEGYEEWKTGTTPQQRAEITEKWKQLCQADEIRRRQHDAKRRSLVRSRGSGSIHTRDNGSRESSMDTPRRPASEVGNTVAGSAPLSSQSSTHSAQTTTSKPEKFAQKSKRNSFLNHSKLSSVKRVADDMVTAAYGPEENKNPGKQERRAREGKLTPAAVNAVSQSDLVQEVRQQRESQDANSATENSNTERGQRQSNENSRIQNSSDRGDNGAGDRDRFAKTRLTTIQSAVEPPSSSGQVAENGKSSA